jgi:hypothetical protein
MIFSDIARTIILGGILMGIFLSFTPVEARLAPYDGIGGNGGAPFRLDCGEYGVLVGLNGRSGAVVDQVTGLCVKIDPVSGIWVGGVYETNPAGGTGGGRFHKICPVGQALTGIQGNSTYFQGNEVVRSLAGKPGAVFRAAWYTSSISSSGYSLTVLDFQWGARRNGIDSQRHQSIAIDMSVSTPSASKGTWQTLSGKW